MFDFTYTDRFHIGYDGRMGWIYFWMLEKDYTGTATDLDKYPKVAYIYDVNRQRWVGTRRYRWGVQCNVDMADSIGVLRTAFANVGTGVAATYGSYVWCDNIGTGFGTGPSTTVNPTITGVSLAAGVYTITCSAANLSSLTGVPATLVRAADGSTEDFYIDSSTSTTMLTAHSFTGAAPVTTDTVMVGPIPARYRTGRLDAGVSDRKKKWVAVHVPLKYKSAAVPVKMKVYLDDKAVADTDNNAAYTEDGVTVTASSAVRSIDSTTYDTVYQIPLNCEWRHHITLEFYSDLAGVPWEISGPIKVIYDIDDAERPRGK
jgi:hypothetical protein